MYNDHHFACTTCGEDFSINANLCQHTISKHIVFFHVCLSFFVPEDKLQEHLAHPDTGTRNQTQEQMIEDKWALEHGAKQQCKEETWKKNWRKLTF